MARQRRALGTAAVAFAIIVLVIGSGFGATAFIRADTVQSTNNTASSVSASKANNVWNFTVSIGSSSVEQGQSLQLVARLANIGPTNQAIQNYVEPYINSEVYPSNGAWNGTIIWAWNPPTDVWGTWTVPSGQALIQVVNIPTSELNIGQTYAIRVTPLSGSTFSGQGNLAITIQFSVS